MALSIVCKGFVVARSKVPIANFYSNAIVKAEKVFLAGIKLTGIDDVGIISSLTDIISKNMGVNMKSITIESHDGTFEGTIVLYIQYTAHLDSLIKNIMQKHQNMEVKRIAIAN